MRFGESTQLRQAAEMGSFAQDTTCSDELVLVGVARRGGARRDVELAEDVAHVPSIVLSLKNSSAAIALLVLPAATSRSTCSSRGVSPWV